MFIGDGAKLVRDAFALAKEKSKPGIFFPILDPIMQILFLPQCGLIFQFVVAQGLGTKVQSFSLMSWMQLEPSDLTQNFPVIARSVS